VHFIVVNVPFLSKITIIYAHGQVRELEEGICGRSKALL
jgi:hypothetical protein